MLALGKVKEIERLLAEGRLSQRKIAKALGVSRGVVDAIASGKRPDYEARRQQRADDGEPQGPIERCPTCGARVYMPCRLCRVRSAQTREQTLLRTMRHRAREQALRRLLVAILRAAIESQAVDETPRVAAGSAGVCPPVEPAA